LMGLSYDLLAQVETDRTAEVIRTFHRMVARLCEGQALDTAFETRHDVLVPDYLDMIARKTGALVEAALDLGGLIGGADDAARKTLRTAGHELGRAFQIQDDLLDLTADSDGWGKAIGGDLVVGKKTFLLLRALECAQGDEHRWFSHILTDGGLPPEEVPEARARMKRLGVLDDARDAVRRHSDAGLAALGTLPPGPSAEALRDLAEQLARRLR
ncbi:MAG: polyprenyl synthetase family protein, partial [Rhodothermaceae bacterium]|nr:polyprenyl synthetase family protein [Rhodothermaceae bacterium]